MLHRPPNPTAAPLTDSHETSNYLEIMNLRRSSKTSDPSRGRSSLSARRSPLQRSVSLIAASILAGNFASAAEVYWDFATASPSSNTATNLTVSAVTQVNNNGTTTMLGTTSASTGYAGASGTNNAGAAARIGALNTGSGGSAAFEFTLTPDATFNVSLTGLEFGTRSTSTGPQAYSLRSSADSFASDIATGTIGANSTWSLKSNSGLTSTSGSAITYRLYGHSGAGSPGTNTANWRIDDLKLTVTVDDGGPDTTPPSVATLVPTNGATNVAVDSNLVLTFSEPVVPLTGSITLKKADNSTVQTFAVPAGISHSGSVVTLDPTNDLEEGVSYYVEITAGAFEDAAGNDFAGISGNSTWAFSTVGPDITGPVVSAVIPAANAVNVPLMTPIKLTFDELISPNPTGVIYIRRQSDNSIVATFDAANNLEVAPFNNVVDIFLATSLPPNTALYLDVPAGTFVDNSANANPMAAYTSNFTTVDVPTLLASPAYTQNFSGFSSTNPTLPIGWSLSGPVTTFNATAGNQLWGEGTTSGLRGGASLLGFQHTGSTGNLVKTLTLINGTGSTITDLTISYTGRVERAIEGRSPAYTVTVDGTTIPALGFSTTSPDGTVRLSVVTGLAIDPGQSFQISWTSDRGLTGSGASKQIGLTDVSVSVGSGIIAPSLSGPTVVGGTLTPTSVSVAAAVTADGGAALTQRGFVYSLASTNATPEIGGTGVTTVIDPDTTVEAMEAELTGLTFSSTYAVRAFATNSVGTTYTSVLNVTTLALPPALVSSYTQAFNGFTGTLPSGWTVYSDGGVNGYAGVWGPSTSSGGMLGGVSNPGVLGYQHVGSSGVTTVTLSLVNDTGGPLTQLWVSYLGRVSRETQTRHPAWTVTVAGMESSALAYSTASAVDETKGALVTGLNIPQGEVFTITWVSDRGLNAGGSSRQIGIANVVVALEQPADDFGTWAGSFTPPITSGPTGDDDGDGLTNEFEYAFGLNPRSGSSASPYTAPLDKATAKFRYTRRTASMTGLSYKVYTSTTLGAWTLDAGATQTVISTVGDVQTVEVTLSAPAPLTAARLFVRVTTD